MCCVCNFTNAVSLPFSLKGGYSILPDAALFRVGWIHFAANGTLEDLRKFFAVLEHLVGSNSVRSMLIFDLHIKCQ